MFIRVNGKVYGPYNEQQIAQFVKDGRLIPASEVSFDNINWMTASQVPQLFGNNNLISANNLSTVDSENPIDLPQTESQNYDYGDVSDPNITFFGAYKRCWKCYSRTSGRARRKEYWAWSFFNSAISFVMVLIIFTGIVISTTGSETQGDTIVLFSVIPLFLFGVATIVPSVCVLIRRLHDMNMSGWVVQICLALYILWCFDYVHDRRTGLLALLGFIPYIGGIITLIFGCIDGTAGPNNYGPDPKGRNSTDSEHNH